MVILVSFLKLKLFMNLGALRDFWDFGDFLLIFGGFVDFGVFDVISENF